MSINSQKFHWFLRSIWWLNISRQEFVYSDNQYLLLYCVDTGAEVAMIRLLRVILRALCTEQGSLKPWQTKYTSLYTVQIADNSLVSLLSTSRSPAVRWSCSWWPWSLSCPATRPLSKAPFVMLAGWLGWAGAGSRHAALGCSTTQLSALQLIPRPI